MSSSDVLNTHQNTDFLNVPPATAGQTGAGTGSGAPAVGTPARRVVYRRTTQVFINRFPKTRRRAFGVMQTLVGLLLLGFGIFLAVQKRDNPLFPVFSGIFFSCFVIFTSSGALTVTVNTVECKLYMTKCSLGLNVLSIVMAVTGLSVILAQCLGQIDTCEDTWIMVVFVMFTVLQSFTSLSLAVFGCRGLCCSDSPVPLFSTSETFTSFQPHISQQDDFYNTNPNYLPNSPYIDNPPPYSPENELEKIQTSQHSA